jgi:hypothetical protein
VSSSGGSLKTAIRRRAWGGFSNEKGDLRTLGLAHVMFRQVRAYIANDSDSAGHACKVAESLQCSHGIVQDGGGVAPGNDLVDDEAIEKRADDSDARVSEFVCSSGIHRASLRLCKYFRAGPN